MIYATRSTIVAVLLLCFCVNVTVADRWAIHLHRRDGPTTSTNSVADSTTNSNQASPATSIGGSSTQNSASKASITAFANSTSSTAPSTTSSTVPAITAISSNLNGASPTSALNLNYTGYNYTLTPNALPIVPQVTPGFAVGGVILIITGAVYTLVGIKNKWLHIYISAAYLASLAVTVLIIYVMNPPVSNAIQGAYLVAVVMTGLILGGAAIIFTEMTEGLGCLLGGFCLSMWFLVLKPGGLLTSTSGKAIFISCFTIAGFSTSFSHKTRPYGLIVLISFGGATAVVLGIDCFSRAGLKEFWAYLWALNTNLFPLGATSYPLTRGIRVEIASIVVIFLAGVISQMKLWKIIKERRSQRAAERLNDERTMEQEEENVGRRIEHANAEERGQWEAVYGDKDASKSTVLSNRDSGVGDMDSQKRGPTSTVTSVKGEETIEMADMTQTQKTPAGLVMTDKDGGPITVRVARDIEQPEIDEFGLPATSPTLASPRNSTFQTPEEEKTWVIGTDGEARLERKPSQFLPKRNSSVIPKIVPLPFKVPDGDFADDRSSVATFADEDPAGEKRRSRHLSAGSMLLRKLSKRSNMSLQSPRSPRSARNSRNFSIGEGPSAEDLVSPREESEFDRASSLAATMDGLSDDEEMSVRSSVHQAPDTTEVAGPAQGIEIVLAKDVEKLVLEPEIANEHVTSDAKNVPQDSITSTDLKPEDELVAPKQAKGTSNVSAIDSKQSSITKERLPPQMSRVVMSYRTNEWAKHLSQADAPEFEELKLASYATETSSSTPAEVPVPVRVEELQQTAESSTQPQPPTRSPSQISLHHPPPQPTRTNSSLSRMTINQSTPNLERSLSTEGLNRSLSQQSFHSHITTNATLPRNNYRSTSSPAIPQPIVESPIEADFSSVPNLPPSTHKNTPSTPYGTPSTLISKRDSMLRQKYLPSSTLSSTPENVTPSPLRYQTSQQLLSQQSYPSPIPSARAESDAGSMYNYPNTNAVFYGSAAGINEEEEENMSLSTRRELIRQASLSSQSFPTPPTSSSPSPMVYDSHQPRRQASGPSPVAREQQLASWRASVQAELASTSNGIGGIGGGIGGVGVMGGGGIRTIERQRSQLWAERMEDEKRRMMEEKRKVERESVFDERMRRGDMLDAHREALRRMQRGASGIA